MDVAKAILRHPVIAGLASCALAGIVAYQLRTRRRRNCAFALSIFFLRLVVQRRQCLVTDLLVLVWLTSRCRLAVVFAAVEGGGTTFRVALAVGDPTNIVERITIETTTPGSFSFLFPSHSSQLGNTISGDVECSAHVACGAQV